MGRCEDDPGRATDLQEDRNRDGGIQGFGSGEEGGIGYPDHRRGGLSDRGEGQGTGH